jgi:uncharacterized surface protein with fasciclin (FAS1) repeats
MSNEETGMTKSHWLGAATALLLLAGCGDRDSGNVAGNAAADNQAGAQTIASGLDQESRFLAATRAAGLDATLAGPGPYTVLVPSDEAFGKLPAGTLDSWMQPESRAELTRVLTYHILTGTVLAEDIGRAIDNSDGRALLATIGGDTLTATRDGGNVVLTDAAGTRATITRADETRSNGVVHHIDAVLMPGPGQAQAQGPQAPPKQQ